MTQKSSKKHLYLGMTGGQLSIVIVFSVLILAVLILGVLLITDQSMPQLAQIQTVATPTTSATLASQAQPTYPPTWTPTPADQCAKLADAYLRQVAPHTLKFLDALKVAQATARIALSSVIQNLQSIERDVESIKAPTCAQRASGLMIAGMNSQIDAFLDFMAQSNDSTIGNRLTQGGLDMANATDQLTALAKGLPTPIAQTLPTVPPTVAPTFALTITSTPPTFTAKATSIPNPAKLDDDTYRIYLAQRFNKIGPHVLTLEKVDIEHYRSGGKDTASVTFNIGLEEVKYLNEEDTSASRKAWATALLRELKSHWPNQDVHGSLLWSFVSFSVSSDSNCSSTGTTLLDDGWVNLVYFARALYSPDFGDSIDCY